ncbi:MAG TPA: YidC/Oxa1 family membrane protein insertase [Dehalococcoidales bacterium]|nr:YidC/Oxa1 family membrane protein insertase [Dehalococcoidales bacterium]
MNAWDLVLLQPLINILIAISHYLFNSFGITIIVLTLIIRFILLPLTLKQLRASKKMQDLQPQLLELQKKYAKDKQKLAQEQMKLYKESGVNAAGCALTMIIQFPIWIALYQAIILALALNPEALINLSRYLYSWVVPLAALPFEPYFLGMNLANPNAVLAILVGVSMWIQQKMVTPTTQDPRTAQQSQMMLWMMPLMFTFFSFSFPAGLALYWFVSNIISIVIQYFVTGWGSLNLNFIRNLRRGSKPQESGRERQLKKRLENEARIKKDESGSRSDRDSSEK